MKRLERILVYADTEARSHPAIEKAGQLARASGAKLRLIDVLPQAPWPLRLLRARGRDVAAAVDEQIATRLAELAGTLARQGIEVDTGVRTGAAFAALIREAVDGSFDLLLKSARGSEGLPFGSTALHLIRKCPCPVWIVRETPREAAQVVLAAIDPRPEPEDIASIVLAAGLAVAELERSQLHVVNAWSAYGEARLHRHMPEDALARYVDDVEREVARTAREFVRLHAPRLPQENLHLIKGEPAAVIASTAHRLGAQLVAMGTLAGPGLPGKLIGTTAEQVLLRISCSVLAVKPPGFVSPVL